MKKLIPILIMVALTCCDTMNAEYLNTTPVKSLDLNRYMGKWYEVARFDHSFERGLERVTAEYALNSDGTVKVTNSGYREDGSRSIAVGKAKTTDDPGILKVSFFWFFYAQYRVLELEENYQYALVGGTSSKYLWILSRQPQLDETTLQQILSKANERGYDTSKLIFVKQ